MSSLSIKNKLKLAIIIAAFFVFGNFIYTTHAAPNPQINYQGKLTNQSGVAVPNGTYNMRFWLLTSPSIATTSAIWTESLTGSSRVTVTNGLFSVMLGSTTSLTGINFNQTLYLGVEVGGTGSPVWDGEMSPRKILGTVPAAFVAVTAISASSSDNALALGGVASTSFLRSDQVDTATSLLTFSGGLVSTASSTILNLTTTNATTTNLVINGTLKDSLNSVGTNGFILRTTGTGTQWVATSSLGLSTAFTNSAGLAALLSDESGTGVVAFTTNPAFTTPNLGTPSAATLTNATGLPISTGLTGAGTGVLTALGVNVGTAGSFLVNGGALGTPSSGDLSNATNLPIIAGTTGTLTVARGGTGSTTLNAGEILVGNGTNPVTSTTTAGLKITLGLNNVENTALSTWAGSTNITTLGTITAGTWNGTAIAGTRGGTGLTSVTQNQLLIGGAGNTWTQIATSSLGLGTVTSISGSGGTTGLTLTGGPITTTGTLTLGGTLAVANGGTGITSFGSGVATFLGTPSSANLAAAVTDETGTGNLVFSSSPTFSGTPLIGVNPIWHGGNDGTTSGLDADLLDGLSSSSFSVSFSNSAGLAALLSDESGTGTAVFTNSPTLVNPNLGTPSSATLTNATGLPLTTGVTGTLAVGNGGTGATTLGAGQILVGNGTGAITSTTTANLKITLGLNNVENTALSTWAGSTNITTLGTITAGTWNGTAIAGTRGGTGLTSVTQNQLLIGGVGNTWTQIATSSLGYSASFSNSAQLAALLSDESGTGVVAFTTSPVFTTPNLGTPSAATLTNATGLPLTTGVTGVLPIANGGTNASSQTTNGVAYFNGTGVVTSANFSYSGGAVSVSNSSTGTTTDTLILRNPNGASVNTGTALHFDPNGNGVVRSASIKSRQTLSGNYADLGFFTAPSDTPAERMTITALGNVGIGTTTPGTLFSVSGNSTLRTVLPEGLNTNNISPYSLGASNARWANVWAEFVNVGTSTWSIAGRGSSQDRFAIFDGPSGTGSERFTISNTGNVGIGSTTPAGKLGVAGDIYSNNLLMQGDGTNAYIRPRNAGSILTLGAADTNYMSINASGVVNITNLTASRLIATDASKNLVSTITSADLAASISDETGSGLAVFATSPTLTTPNIGAATGASLNLSSGAITSGLINGQTISSAANFTGSVAIATTLGVTGKTTLGLASTTVLTATGNIYAGAVLVGSTGTVYGVDQGGSIELKGTNSSASPYIDIGVAGGDYEFRQQLNIAGGTYNIFSSTTAQILTLRGNGNVGIGTNNPQVKLDLVGDMGIAQGNNLRFPHSSQSDANDGKIGAGLFAPGLNIIGIKTDTDYRKIGLWGQITQQENSGTNTWLGTNYFNGNVGIGTSTPVSRLNVHAADNTELLRLSSTAAPNLYHLKLTGVSGSTGDYRIQTVNNGSTADALYIKGTGQIGIGTTAPRGPLHVQEGSNGSYTFIQSGNATNGTLLTSTDTIPVVSGNGFVGYNGLAIIPQRWGTAGGAADAHNVLYLGGSQTNNGAVASSLAFGNWGYFTGTTTAAGGLGNATAQADAVKFHFEHQDLGSAFNQRLTLFSRSSSGVDTAALTILSSGNVGINNTAPGSALSVGAIGTLREVSVGMQNTLFRMRERSISNDFALSTNINDGAAQDNATYASWVTRFGGGSDTWSVARSAPGSGSLVTLVDINGAGNLRAYGEVQATMATGFGQFRSVYGNYGMIERNDGANYYMLVTNSGNQYGIWNDYRPFTMNLATGNITLATTSISTTLGVTGAVSLGSTLNVNGIISGNSKEIFNTTDAYLRINQNNSFSNGIWLGGSNLLSSGSMFAIGSNGGTTNSRVTIKGGTYNGTNVIDLDGATGNIIAMGSVGVGTTTPIGKMQVNGDLYIGNGSGSQGASLVLYGNSSPNVTSSIFTSSGNLHIDAAAGAYGTYLNYYRGTGGVIFGNGASGSSANVSASGVYNGTGLNVGSGTVTSGAVNGQTISSAASFTGTLTTAGVINSAGGLQLSGTTVVGGTANDVYINSRVIRSLSTLNDGMFINYGGTGGPARIYDGGTTNAVIVGTGGTLDVPGLLTIPSAAFGATTGDKLQLYSNTYGIGIESSTLTNWSGSQFRWRTGGTSVSGGTERMLLTTTGLSVTGTLSTTGTINSQTISSAANFTGSLVVGTTLGVTGAATFNSTIATNGRIVSAGSLPTLGTIGTSTGGLGALEAISSGSGGTAGAAYITFHRPGAFATYLGLDTDNVLKLGGWSHGASAFTIWHSGNDGAGSTLDADTLDGLSSASFLNTTAIDTSSELVAIVTDETGTGALVFATSPTLTTPNIGAATGASLSLTGNANVGGGLSGRRLDVYSTANNGDGIAIGQDTDNTQTIQAYIDNQWAGRVGYASGCCNGLKLQPDVGYVQIGSTLTIDNPGNMSGVGTITSGAINGQTISSAANFTGTVTAAGRATLTGSADSGGNLRFSATNPYIWASSYIHIPGGLYINGGTLYAENTAMFRGGITNDTAAALQINGGTSGYTYINGRLGIGDSTPVSYLSINPNNDGLTNTSSAFIVGNSTTLGTGAAAYLYPSEIQGAAGSVIRLQDALHRRVAGSGWQGTAYRMQYAVDNSFTDGSKAFVEVGAGDPTDSGGGFVALATNGVIRISADNLGDVAIGADTSAARLDVVETRYSGLGVDVLRVRSNYYGGVDTVFRVDAIGNVFSDGGTAMGSPADIAENFPASEPVTTGMVVAFSTSTTETWSLDARATSTTFLHENTFDMATVRKARHASEAVGVISTRPGVLLSANTENGVPVALSGRVPVKVTTENGLIKIGDYLTVSATTPGYAMKATGSGPTIGQAISDYDHTMEQVLVFVDNGYENLTEDGSRRLTLFDTLSDDSLAALVILTGTSTTLNAAGESETIWSRLVTLADNFVDGILSVITLKADRVDTTELNTDKLCLDGVCITADEFRQLLDNNSIQNETPTTEGEGETPSNEEVIDENTDNGTGSTTDPGTGTGEEVGSAEAESEPITEEISENPVTEEVPITETNEGGESIPETP